MLNELLRLLVILLRRVLGVGPPTPKRPLILTVEESFMPHEFKYTFGLAPPSAPDVAKFVVAVDADGATEEFELEATETTFTRQWAPGVNVSISVVDVDGAGNKSEPSVPLAFVVEDTVPPPQPGPMTVENVEEVFTPDEPPAPEPPPVP